MPTTKAAARQQRTDTGCNSDLLLEVISGRSVVARAVTCDLPTTDRSARQPTNVPSCGESLLRLEPLSKRFNASSADWFRTASGHAGWRDCPVGRGWRSGAAQGVFGPWAVWWVREQPSITASQSHARRYSDRDGASGGRRCKHCHASGIRACHWNVSRDRWNPALAGMTGTRSRLRARAGPLRRRRSALHCPLPCLPRSTSSV